MKIKYVLFDLDGTLLPMDQDAFMKAYFGGLCKKLAPYGYNPDELISAIWQGTKMMVKNCGDKTNEEVFWDAFVQLLGERVLTDSHLLDEYYIERFDDVQVSCGYNEKAKIAVDKIKELKNTILTQPNNQTELIKSIDEILVLAKSQKEVLRLSDDIAYRVNLSNAVLDDYKRWLRRELYKIYVA